MGSVFGSMYLDARLLLGKDLVQIRAGGLSNIHHALWTYRDRLHYYYRFKDQAKAHPNRVFLYFEGKEYTLRQLEKASNRMAHWLLSLNIHKDDVVCMMHQNHPTFYIVLLAISKIGAIPALINTNLSGDSLAHCVTVAKASMLIFDPVYETQVESISAKLSEQNIRLYAYGESTETGEIPDLHIASAVTPMVLESFSERDTSESYLKGINLQDPAYLIYTSGTTGLPKAAISQHARICYGMSMYSKTAGIKENQRVYCVLPLYHSSGLIVASSVTLFAGGSIVLGRKFSASRFWNDCVDYKVDVFSYIGEFCRYLLSQPPHPLERKHHVQLVYGNGMRPDIWNKFRDRFNIPKICEFYAATEAPTSMFNVNSNDFGAGAVGFRGRLMRSFRRELKIIKIDPITEDPLRGKDGFCIQCPYGEQGELLVMIDEASPVQFSGYYKNNEATTKKVLTDVFVKGDAYFRSGDLLHVDADGFFFFGDRVGDTFRWKSENVATTEVAQAVSTFPGITEANIYGALVPNHDGRAGMAAIVIGQEGIDFKAFYQHLSKKLPRYAIPVFIRFVPSMEMTGTFKQQKVEYRNQGIDLAKIPEEGSIYWLQKDTYVPFTKEDLNKLEAGKSKL
ncbi:hypothetical protein J3Q64DRAFT_1751979 [Phycomyces blakesleeanus]|uniref:AMP-dependent synthetase/ligase domain-containing protein n=1 Tax=Phycomyces blakesleeanus TaxID=4837 RepID=A0ABR3AUW1_PHYBL